MHVNQKYKNLFSIFPHLVISKTTGNLNLMPSPFNTNMNSISYLLYQKSPNLQFAVRQNHLFPFKKKNKSFIHAIWALKILGVLIHMWLFYSAHNG